MSYLALKKANQRRESENEEIDREQWTVPPFHSYPWQVPE